MKITVTTPTGNIGKVVADRLLEAGAEIVVPCRSPEKVKGFTDRGATAKQGSMDDVRFLTDAFRGSDALFWLTPPDLSAPDYVAFYRKTGQTGAAAVKEAGVKRVVNLSSVGAHLQQGTGPIKGLYPIERMFEDAAPDVTHVRAAFFFENYLPQVASIKEEGCVFMPVKGASRLAMAATRDIGEVIAKRLLDTSWSGHQAVGVLGPADLSFDEAAVAISEGLGRDVKHVTVSGAQAREAMLGMGVGESIADLLIEMYGAIDSGVLEIKEPRTPETTTSTTLTAWTRDVLKPMVG
jgi:uncharacterized protein YbjT (DUF2867 family)